MPYLLIADAVLLLHMGFVVFAIAGGLAVWRWPRIAWLHLPALAWGAYVVLSGTICPLTPLENALRHAGGASVYRESFIAHYLIALIYPSGVQGPAGRDMQIGLGVALLVFNVLVYGLVLHRRRRRTAR